MNDGGADLTDRVDHVAIAQQPQPAPVADKLEGPEAHRTPLLALDGFDGPLERLLTLARAQHG
jgi:hypothetical protein